jgi:hypothetical protein
MPATVIVVSAVGFGAAEEEVAVEASAALAAALPAAAAPAGIGSERRKKI